MSARLRPAPGADHSFRLRGIAVTFRATRIGDAVRVETIGLDDAAINHASAMLMHSLAVGGLDVVILQAAPHCRRCEVDCADIDRVRQEFARVSGSLTKGGAA